MRHLDPLTLGLGAALAGLSGGLVPPFDTHLLPTCGPDALPWMVLAVALAAFAARPPRPAKAPPHERLAAGGGEEQEGLLL
jgi:hypothetical protein